MRAVLTRVTDASVAVDGTTIAEIICPDTCGILALVGVHRDDGEADVDTLARKISELRILPGEKSASDINAPILLVSQFTLYGRTAKGRRPSFSDAAPAAGAEPLFFALVDALRAKGLSVSTGRFGAMMTVNSTNSGPFTVLVET